MAASKCKGFRKKRNTEIMTLISRLRQSLVILSRLHSDHYKLMERFLSLEKAKQTLQQPIDKGTKDLPSELNKKGQNLTEEDSKLDDDDSPNTNVGELQNQLREALERNKQWLEYDQERDAFVRATMGRMLWLEKQLNEASPACSKKHNKDHSDENEQIRQMQEYYEPLLQKAKNELEVLRERVDITQNNLTKAQKWCKDREEELEENKDLQEKLCNERRRSANSELQVNVLQQIVRNHHSATREEIEHLERRNQIYAQDLEDERQNCAYLREQLTHVLKSQKKTDCHEPKTIKFKNTPSQLASGCGPSSVNESLLACPGCGAMYPVSEYQDLLDHVDTCYG